MTELEYWNEKANAKDVLFEVWADTERTQECLDAIIPEILPVTGIVIDLGCAIGRLIKPMAQMFPDTKFIGIDFSAHMILQAPTLSNVEYIINDGNTINVSGKVDAVYSMIMFQHIPNEWKQIYINQVSNILKEGGRFRFQIVEGTDCSFQNHHVKEEEVKQWCYNAGLTIKKVDRSLMYPNWIWITAIK